ncbi:hypothetical protein [Nocardioides dilutus]
MIVSHAHRFAFLKTRKTAGTSVEIALSTVCGPDDVITPVTEADERLRAECGGRPPQNYESPPLPRKAFNHMPASMVRQLVGRQTWDDYYTFSIERNPWDAVVSLFHWRHRDDPAPPAFADFVHEPVVEELAVKNFRGYRINGELAVDRVLRYESLGDDLGELWAHLGLPGEPRLPRAKGGSRPRGPSAASSYASYYDDDSRAHVAELFAAAIADFGYTF